MDDRERSSTSSSEPPPVSRRTLLRAGAWAVPGLAASAALAADPAAATSLEAVGSARPVPAARTNARPAAAFGAFRSFSLVDGETYTGVVPIQIEIDERFGDPSLVRVTLGRQNRIARRLENSRIWATDDWDTMRKLGDPAQVSPSNYLVWAQVHAVFAGLEYVSDPIHVYTGNYDYGVLSSVGWSPELAWEADYSSNEAFDESHEASIVGQRYSRIVPDPIRPRRRNAMLSFTPDVGDYGATGQPRFQSQSPSAWYEGHEGYVGFSILVPERDSSRYLAGGFPHVDLSDPGDTNRHIAIFQIYGPQASQPSDYPAGRGASTIIDANRNTESDPIDRFHIAANQLNGGDPGYLIDFDYNRGKWTDIVLGFHMSADVKRGWIEVYLNLGDHDAVQPIPLFGGMLRLPRVTAWPQTSTPPVPPTYDDGVLVTGGSRRNRTDMQVYRSRSAYDQVFLYQTAHKIGPTVESVDPRSYRS